MNIFFFVTLFLSQSILGQSTVQFTGEASQKGKLIYRELHVAEYDKTGNIISAQTEYMRPDGTKIATLKSDFSKSITAPAHVFYDERFKSKYGIRYENEKIVLFSQDDGKEEETKIVDSTVSSDGLIVGCQGLAYHFKKQGLALKEKQKIPIQFLIPGSLESYDFELLYKSETADLMNFEIHIKNWFLRLFAPKLDIQFKKENWQMVSYKGLSNLYDDKKQKQVVDIVYKY